VQDSRELLEQWIYWIQHLSELRWYGENAKEALLKLGGVSEKQVEIVMRALFERAPRGTGMGARTCLGKRSQDP
jgi:hypothetical protein